MDGVIVLIAVMGGRVTPSFTSSYVGHTDPNFKVKQSLSLDRNVMFATWAMLVVDQISPLGPVAGAISLFAAVLHAVRLSGWKTGRTLQNPILWVLHLAYGWMVLGLALKALGDWGVVAPGDVLHALTIGAVGNYTLGIMTRASLGHTGRKIHAARPIVWAYVLVSAAAVLRLAVAVLPELSTELVMASGAAWTVAFAIFFAVYAPILMRPRVDGRPG
ncbi:MAG: NnrS family protein [Alphaproteobacteria bacterium]|nr:NnrS family protein [Alphaproteobacteria bacterium]